jgi:hypothetical protein
MVEWRWWGLTPLSKLRLRDERMGMDMFLKADVGKNARNIPLKGLMEKKIKKSSINCRVAIFLYRSQV